MVSNLSKCQSWSLIVLCYNEEASIEKTIFGAISVFDSMDILDYEVIIVDDGSRDQSRPIVEKLTSENPKIRAVFHKKNLGIGEALKSGYRAAKMENVGAIPGDGQFRIADIKMHPRIEGGDALCFYREKKRQYTPYRKLLSTTNRMVNLLLFNLRIDDINWVKFYKRSMLQSFDLRTTSSLVETEICAKMAKRGIQFKQYPTAYLDRLGGVAHGASFKTVLRAIKDILFLFLAVRVFDRAEKIIRQKS